jgi:hypothetical protein
MFIDFILHKKVSFSDKQGGRKNRQSITEGQSIFGRQHLVGKHIFPSDRRPVRQTDNRILPNAGSQGIFILSDQGR